MENAEIARVLSELADVLEPILTRGAPIAAPETGSTLPRQGGLPDLPDIGEGIADEIGEILDAVDWRACARRRGATNGGEVARRGGTRRN